jgi:hypothetical protein
MLKQEIEMKNEIHRNPSSLFKYEESILF